MKELQKLLTAICDNTVDSNELVKNLLKENPNLINETDKDGNTPLHIAAESGNVTILSTLTSTPRVNLHTENKAKKTPLSLACSNNQVDVVDWLLTHFRNLADFDALASAASAGCVEVVRVFYRHGLISLNSNGQSIFAYAAKYGHFEILKLAQEFSWDLKADKDPFGTTPLHRACTVEIAQWLKEMGLDIDCQNAYGDTPFMAAVITCSIDLVKWYLQQGVQKKLHNTAGQNILHMLYIPIPRHVFAFYPFPNPINRNKILQLLLQDPKTMDLLLPLEDTSRKSPLHYAVESQDFNAVNLMLHAAPELFYTYPEVWFNATWVEMIKVLYDYRRKINFEDQEGNTLLHHLVAQQKLMTTEAIQWVIAKGANINAVNKNQLTPLELCISSINLLAADREAKGQKGYYLKVLYRNLFTVVPYLLEQGALVRLSILDQIVQYQTQYSDDKGIQDICLIMKFILERYNELQNTTSTTLSLKVLNQIHALQRQLEEFNNELRDNPNAYGENFLSRLGLATERQSNVNPVTGANFFPSLKQLATVRVANLTSDKAVDFDLTKLPNDLVQPYEVMKFPKATFLSKYVPDDTGTILAIKFVCKKIKNAMNNILTTELKHLESNLELFALKIQILAADLLKQINSVDYNKKYSVDIRQQKILEIVKGMTKFIDAKAKEMGCFEEVKDLLANFVNEKDNSNISVATKLVNTMQLIIDRAKASSAPVSQPETSNCAVM